MDWKPFEIKFGPDKRGTYASVPAEYRRIGKVVEWRPVIKAVREPEPIGLPTPPKEQ